MLAQCVACIYNVFIPRQATQSYVVLYQVTVAIIMSYQSEILDIFNCIGINLISNVEFTF